MLSLPAMRSGPVHFKISEFTVLVTNLGGMMELCLKLSHVSEKVAGSSSNLYFIAENAQYKTSI